MDASQRGALMLVRVIALALLGWSIVNFALYLAITQHDHAEMQIIPCLLKFLPGLVGIILLIKARALAEWIADKLEE